MVLLCASNQDLQHNYNFTLGILFQEDVDAFMNKEDNANDAQSVIMRLDEQLNKYKFMEAHLQARRKK